MGLCDFGGLGLKSVGAGKGLAILRDATSPEGECFVAGHASSFWWSSWSVVEGLVSAGGVELEAADESAGDEDVAGGFGDDDGCAGLEGGGQAEDPVAASVERSLASDPESFSTGENPSHRRASPKGGRDPCRRPVASRASPSHSEVLVRVPQTSKRWYSWCPEKRKLKLGAGKRGNRSCGKAVSTAAEKRYQRLRKSGINGCGKAVSTVAEKRRHLERMTSYRQRLVDGLLAELLAELPTLMLVGPRAVGKTTTALRHAKSVVRLDRPAEAAAFKADPDAALRVFEEPVLLDEWQVVPEVLGAVKRAVDSSGRPGRFLLTGSVRVDREEATWPATGRVVRVAMYPLTVAEVLETRTRPCGGR